MRGEEDGIACQDGRSHVKQRGKGRHIACVYEELSSFQFVYL